MQLDQFETERKRCKSASVGLTNVWREFDRNPTPENCKAVMTVHQNYQQKLDEFRDALLSSIPDEEDPGNYLEQITPAKPFSVAEFHRQVQEFGRLFLSDTPGQKFKAVISKASPEDKEGPIKTLARQIRMACGGDTVPVVTLCNPQDVPDEPEWLSPFPDDDDDTLNPDLAEAPTPEPPTPSSEASQPDGPELLGEDPQVAIWMRNMGISSFLTKEELMSPPVGPFLALDGVPQLVSED